MFKSLFLMLSIMGMAVACATNPSSNPNTRTRNSNSSVASGALSDVSQEASPQCRPPFPKEPVEKNGSFVRIGDWPEIKSDVRYATNNNFMHENVYGSFKVPYLHKIAAERLRVAIKNLQKEKPEWRFLVFDGFRPNSIQYKLWDAVKGTANEQYVASPERGSNHNFGLAIDISLVNKNGIEVDMGTPYDSFQEKAQPQLEGKFIANGQLTKKQLANRLILRRAMTAAGFTQLSNEWWHYEITPLPCEL